MNLTVKEKSPIFTRSNYFSGKSIFNKHFPRHFQGSVEGFPRDEGYWVDVDCKFIKNYEGLKAPIIVVGAEVNTSFIEEYDSSLMLDRAHSSLLCAESDFLIRLKNNCPVLTPQKMVYLNCFKLPVSSFREGILTYKESPSVYTCKNIETGDMSLVVSEKFSLFFLSVPYNRKEDSLRNYDSDMCREPR